MGTAPTTLHMCTRDAGCAETPDFGKCDTVTQTCVAEGSACNAACTMPFKACSDREVCSRHTGTCVLLSNEWCNSSASDNACEDGYMCSTLFNRCVQTGPTCMANIVEGTMSS